MASTYLCIDLKSFYASVECVERGLDPLKALLVVADPSRTDKTICLAVSPALKALGVRNRCRLYEVPANLDYIIALPQMQKYIDYSADIYGIYLKYVAAADIHVYSIDEAFLDVTSYLKWYGLTGRQMASMIISDILRTTGITATCGIGTNLYLTKVALDVLAKHAPDYIAELNSDSFKEKLWQYQPLTDFWRIGGGTARRLAELNIYTMEQLAHTDEEIIRKQFGVDGQLLIDHAWGIEPVTIADIKAYRSKSHSLSNGQAIGTACDWQRGRLLVKEMVDQLCLDMAGQQLITDAISLAVGYNDGASAGGSVHLTVRTNSPKLLDEAFLAIYDRRVGHDHKLSYIGLCCGNITSQDNESYDLFTDTEAIAKEKAVQQALVKIKKKYGINAVLKGMNLLAEGTGKQRNLQIGGHRSGKEK